MTVYNLNLETDAGNEKYRELKKLDSPLFTAIEKIFDDWIEGRSEYEDMYFSEDAIYTKKGAIHGAIEQIFEVMQEEGLKSINLNDKRLDLCAAFE